MKAEAWFIHSAAPGESGPATLVRDEIEIDNLGDDEVLIAPLYGGWEGNMTHAISRRPVDVPRMRGEDRVVIGNSGSGRVLDVGRSVKGFKKGDLVLVGAAGNKDRFGYCKQVFGYDAPGTIGFLSKVTKMPEDWLIKVPEDSPVDIVQWAAFNVRYMTAWSNWHVAYNTFRAQVSVDDMPVLNVWSWGGGTSLATLELATRFGHNTVMLSGNKTRQKEIEAAGIKVVDRSEWPHLSVPSAAFRSDPSLKEKNRADLKSFDRKVRELTGGDKVQIFVDYIGDPVWGATQRALGRLGVVTTAGWREGMNLKYRRAVSCIARQQFVHTHYASERGCAAAVAYASQTGWAPQVSDVFGFDDVPLLAEKAMKGELGMFPCYQVNEE